MFWLRISRYGPFIRIPRVLAAYRSYNRSDEETRARARKRVADEFRYLVEVLPVLPWKDHASASKIIKRVRKKCFIDLLNYLLDFPEIVEKVA